MFCNIIILSILYNISIAKCNSKGNIMHLLRHTNSTLLTQSGVDIKAVQERLGHKNIDETLNIYTHCSQEMIEKSRIIANDIFK